MTTPLIILAILLVPFFAYRFLGGEEAGKSGAVIGLGIAFVFFGLGHFIKTDEMVQMLPPFVPYKTVLVYFTGFLELGLGMLLLFSKSRKVVGLLCIAVFILFFPANIYAAMNYVGMGGHSWGPVYLFIRVPLQLILISCTYWFVVKE